MCGITGFIDFGKTTSELNIHSMTDTLTHRGPDDSGYHFEIRADYHLGIGHRRLSILDLSELGKQPMFFKDYIISFNGEIYNYLEIREELIKLGYQFVSNCDTEVILKAYDKWGTDCIHKFNGMFAIAIFDKKNETLYLFRDRIGIKPLYYYYDGRSIAFASELKAFFHLPSFNKEINKNALYLFIYHGYITAPYSIFENVFKLSQGEALIFKNNKIDVSKYWDLGDKYLENSKTRISNLDTALTKFDDLIKSAVKYRMISDVPIGCFLSSGYDSSIVASVMQELSDIPIDTFSMGFEEEDYNEAHFAKEISAYLGTHHHELYFSINETKSMIEDFTHYFDEPFADQSLFPTMILSKLTKDNVTVALSGDGGDELFCGYYSYESMLKYRNFIGLGKSLHLLKPLQIEKLLYLFNYRSLKLPHLNSVNNMVNNGYLQSEFYLQGIIKGIKSYISPEYYKILDHTENIQEKSMLLDMVTWLPSDILTKVDLASMSVALEARVPLLDYRIVEFSFEADHSLKYHSGEKKYLLKEYLHRRIPKKLMDRPKRGFGVPIFKWLYGDLKYLLDNYFSDEYLTKQNIFNLKVVKRLLNLFWTKREDKNVHNLVWHLLVFQLWWERYLGND